ncbi:hypothetical protein [Ensifer sp. R-19]|uniref:hypothetical protein n=1 Tax=Ensifer sp. R-19 TaxID=3404055 RepID=UPI003CEAE3B4
MELRRLNGPGLSLTEERTAEPVDDIAAIKEIAASLLTAREKPAGFKTSLATTGYSET